VGRGKVLQGEKQKDKWGTAGQAVPRSTLDKDGEKKTSGSTLGGMDHFLSWGGKVKRGIGAAFERQKKKGIEG